MSSAHSVFTGLQFEQPEEHLFGSTHWELTPWAYLCLQTSSASSVCWTPVCGICVTMHTHAHTHLYRHTESFSWLQIIPPASSLCLLKSTAAILEEASSQFMALSKLAPLRKWYFHHILFLLVPIRDLAEQWAKYSIIVHQWIQVEIIPDISDLSRPNVIPHVQWVRPSSHSSFYIQTLKKMLNLGWNTTCVSYTITQTHHLKGAIYKIFRIITTTECQQ